MNNLNITIIISAELSDRCSDVNDIRTAYLSEWLIVNGYGHKTAQGCYKGSKKTCFIIKTDVSNLDQIKDIAQQYGQESVLLVWPKNGTYLVYMDTDKQEYIGVMTGYDKLPSNAEAYTKTNGMFYLAV